MIMELLKSIGLWITSSIFVGLLVGYLTFSKPAGFDTPFNVIMTPADAAIETSCIQAVVILPGWLVFWLTWLICTKLPERTDLRVVRGILALSFSSLGCVVILFFSSLGPPTFLWAVRSNWNLVLGVSLSSLMIGLFEMLLWQDSAAGTVPLSE